MNQISVRQIAKQLSLPTSYLVHVIRHYKLPRVEQRIGYHWQKLEKLLRDPPELHRSGWTYYEPIDTVVELLNQQAVRVCIKPPGLSPHWVPRMLCHHPYSEAVGGASRWGLERQS